MIWDVLPWESGPGLEQIDEALAPALALESA